MELDRVLARRRMVRRFDPEAAVDPAVVERLLDAALRAPSAGFTQGTSFLVLDERSEVARFWSLTSEDGAANRWLDGMRTAPVLVLVWTSKETYLDRYAEPDKGWADRDEGRWSAPYWFVDAGMAAMAMLLSAVDADLGACFFGVPVARQEAVRSAYGIPDEQLSVGVIALGRPAEERRTGSPGRRPRVTRDTVVHRNRW